MAVAGVFLQRVDDALTQAWKAAIAVLGKAAGVIGFSRFFTDRWRRRVPLGLLFWWDMLVIGTAINLVAAFAGLMALGFKAELPVAMAIFLAPLPYSVFLVAAIWRTADRVPPARAQTARLGAALWLLMAMVI